MIIVTHNHLKIALLMLCHECPEQINEFIRVFDENDFDIYIHIDKKADFERKIVRKSNVFLIPEQNRIDVRWGDYSQISATIATIEEARKSKTQYAFFWLCSGRDFPIRSSAEIYLYLKDKNTNFISFAASANYNSGNKKSAFDKRCELSYPNWLKGKELWQRVIRKLYIIITGGSRHTYSFIKRIPPKDIRLFFGSQWWCLNNETIEWICKYLSSHPDFLDFYKSVLVPDETFFQTLVMNSPYAEKVEPNLVYIDWSEGNSSPKYLTEDDYNTIIASGKLFARKIDIDRDRGLFIRLLSRCIPNR